MTAQPPSSAPSSGPVHADGRPTFDLSAVLDRGLCVGCGACSVRTGGRIGMDFTDHGLWQASSDGASAEDLRSASSVCPFSDDARDEDDLSYPAARTHPLPHDPRVGHFGKVLAGRRSDDAVVETSSSGGLTSWVLERLLAEGHVDGVLHVAAADGTDRLVDFTSSYSGLALAGARKSQYYSITLAQVVPRIRGDGRRYAIVGVPCYIKAARLLAESDPVLKEQLVFFAGLVCGHMKSSFFAESFAWQLGVPPEEVASVDFRKKNPERGASQYDFEVTATDGATTAERTLSLTGSVWGHGTFQPEACNFCDDIFAETADVVFGDAWLGEYAADWRGTNVVVTRNPVVDALLEQGAADGELDLTDLGVDRAAKSQGGNFRHRRDGLRIRLADDQAAGLPTPAKRVEPGYDHVPARRRDLFRHRRVMSRASLEDFAEAKRRGDLEHYLSTMRRMIAEYDRLARPGLVDRAKGRIGPRISPLRTRIRQWRSRRNRR